MRRNSLLPVFTTGVFALALVGLLAAVFMTVALVDTPLYAQDDIEEVEEVGEDPPAAAPAATGGDEPEEESKSRLSWALGALGWFFSLVFLALSFTLVALLVMNLLTARRDQVVPMHLVEGFESHIKEKRFQEAYEMAKNDDSFLGNVLAAGLAKLKDGYAQAIEAMNEVGEEENMKLEHRLSYMALIGTVSPMVGLFGTVWGMIKLFDVIARSSTQPKPSELADGISTALLTTLVGLAIAIPAIGAYNILRNRVARLVLEVGIISEGLMSRFQGMGKGKGGGRP